MHRQALGRPIEVCGCPSSDSAPKSLRRPLRCSPGARGRLRLTGAASLFLLAGSTAYGLDCDRHVVDTVNLFTRDQASDLTAAMRGSLQSRFNDAYVLTLHLASTADSLPEAARSAIEHCPNWLDDDGQPKATLIVFALSPAAHKVNILYGPAYAGALDPAWKQIAASAMVPRFRAGDYEAGLLTGMGQVTNALDESEKTARDAEVNSVGLVGSQGSPQQVAADSTQGSLATWITIGFLGLALMFSVAFALSLRRLAEGTSGKDRDPQPAPDKYRKPSLTPCPARISAQKSTPAAADSTPPRSTGGDFLDGVVLGSVVSSLDYSDHQQQPVETPSTSTDNHEPSSFDTGSSGYDAGSFDSGSSGFDASSVSW